MWGPVGRYLFYAQDSAIILSVIYRILGLLFELYQLFQYLGPSFICSIYCLFLRTLVLLVCSWAGWRRHSHDALLLKLRPLVVKVEVDLLQLLEILWSLSSRAEVVRVCRVLPTISALGLNNFALARRLLFLDRLMFLDMHLSYVSGLVQIIFVAITDN